jgi:hypothetical protein
VGLALAGCGKLAGIDDIRYVAPTHDAGSEERAEPDATANETSIGEAEAAPAEAEPPVVDSSSPDVLTDAGLPTHEAASDGSGPVTLDADASEPPDSEPEWSPLELGPSLVLWLDASRVQPNANGYVETWNDRSTYGNDAHGSPQSPPAYARKGAPNSHGALQFDGSMNYVAISDAPSLRWGKDDVLIEVVAAYANQSSPNEYTGYACFFNKTSSSGPFYGVYFGGNGFRPEPDGSTALDTVTYASIASRGWVSNPDVVDVAGATAGVNDSKFHLFGLRRMGITTLEIRLDGARDGEKTSIADVDIDGFARPAYIGGYLFDSSVIHALQGYVAEVVVVRGRISNDQLAKVEDHLKTKYGL